MPGEPELAQSFETLQGFQRRTWCDIRGEDIKKWRDCILVLKDNLLHIYKNETGKSPQMSIGLDKCMIMYAEEYEGKKNVIQLKTFTGRIFCFALPANEVAQDWIRDMKASDYASLKEKVVSLEAGLQAIGLAQDSKAKEDQDKQTFQKRSQAIRNIHHVYSTMRNARALQIMMLWLSACKHQALTEQMTASHSASLQEKEQAVSSMRAQLEEVEKQAAARVQEVETLLRQASYKQSFAQLESLLSTQRRTKEQNVFSMWWVMALREKYEKEMNERVTTLQEQLTNAETVLATTKQEAELANARHQEELAKVESHYATEMQIYHDLQREHTAMKTMLEEMVTSKEESEKQTQALAKQVEQMTASLMVFNEAASSSSDDAQAVIARLQLQINELQTRLEGSQVKEEEYRRKWEALQEFSVDELARAQQKIDELTATCQQLVQQVEDAHNGEHMNKLLEELQGLKLEREMLMTQVQEVQNQYEATVDVVSNSSHIAIERENLLDDMRDRVKALEGELAATNEAKAATETELETLKTTSSETIARLEASEKTQKEELSKLKRRVLALKNMEETMKDVEDLLQQRERQLKDALERVKKAEKTSEACKKEAAEVREENTTLKHQMENYHFREGEAGEVLEKVVEVQVDKPETLEQMAACHREIESLKETITSLESTLQAKRTEEEHMAKVTAAAKATKRLPLKFFPLYPTLQPVEETMSDLPNPVVKVELEVGEHEEVTQHVGRNPDVVKYEEEKERQRREAEERERLRREEEERERLRREEEEKERLRREEEERQRREQEEQERLRREQEEQERLRREQEEQEEQERAKQAASPNPFDQPEEEEEEEGNPFGAPEPKPVLEPVRMASPNPFDQPEEEEEGNPFGAPEPEPEPTSNPFAQPEPEPVRMASPNPFDQPEEEEEEEEGNPFGAPEPELEPVRMASPNPFDQPEEEEEEEEGNPFGAPELEPVRMASPNPFDQPEPECEPEPEPELESASNPFDQPEEEEEEEEGNPFGAPEPEPELEPVRMASPNPFDQPEEEEEEEEEEETNPFAQPEPEPESSSNPFADSNPFAEPEPTSTPMMDMFAGMEEPATSTAVPSSSTSSNPFEDSNPFAEPEPEPEPEPTSTPMMDMFAGMEEPTTTTTTTTATMDFSSLLMGEEEDSTSKPVQETKGAKKSLFGRLGLGRKDPSSSSAPASTAVEPSDNILDLPLEEPAPTAVQETKRWGLSEKNKDRLRGGMGRFSNMIKSAAAKGQSAFAKKVEEPEHFPDVDSSLLELSMACRPLEYFFSTWQTTEEERQRVSEWVKTFVEGESVTMDHLNGLTIERATPFVEEAIRTMLVPLLSLRPSVTVDLMELPTEEGFFTIQVRITEKISPMEDLLSGF